MSVIGNKLQGVYDKLFALLSQFENICVTKFNLLPQQIEKIVAGDNKIASYVDKTIRSITKDDLYGVTRMGSLFKNCAMLIDAVIPDSVIDISTDAFLGCNSLERLTIPFVGCAENHPQRFHYLGNIFGYTLSSYAQHANFVPNSLKEVTLSNKCSIIKSNAFNMCSSLVKVTIGNGVISIGSNAFAGCTSLTDIYLRSTTPPSLESNHTIPTTTTIHVPIGSGDAYKSATNWSYHSDRIVEDIEI